MKNTYYIRYMPASSPSVMDPENYGCIIIRVEAESPAEARQKIPELYVNCTLQIWENNKMIYPTGCWAKYLPDYDFSEEEAA